MPIEWVPLIIFVCVTVFTPGPGNIASAAMGMVFGYRRSMHFLMGMVMGALTILSLVAFVSQELLAVLPVVEPYLRAFGVCYLLWMTYGIARTTYDVEDGVQKPLAFMHGFWLQASNPKAVVFGLTLFTTMLSPLASNPSALALSVFGIGVLTFASVSLWTFAGKRIGKFLHIPSVRVTVNCVLVVLLLYCAYSLSGVQNMIA